MKPSNTPTKIWRNKGFDESNDIQMTLDRCFSHKFQGNLKTFSWNLPPSDLFAFFHSQGPGKDPKACPSKDGHLKKVNNGISNVMDVNMLCESIVINSADFFSERKRLEDMRKNSKIKQQVLIKVKAHLGKVAQVLNHRLVDHMFLGNQGRTDWQSLRSALPWLPRCLNFYHGS